MTAPFTPPCLRATATALLLTILIPLHAQAETGAVAWRVGFDGLSTRFEPALGPDGTIYAGNDSRVTAIAPDGAVRWSVSASTRQGPISVGLDGTVFAITNLDTIVALDPSDGSERWSFPAGANVLGGPDVGPDGNVYAVSDVQWGGLGMFSLTPDGALRWSDEGEPMLTDQEGQGHRIRFSAGRAFVGMVPGIGNPPPTQWSYELDGTPSFSLGSGCDGQVHPAPGDRIVTGNGLCQEVRSYDAISGDLLFAVDAPSPSPCSGMANVAIGPEGSIYTAFCYRAFWALEPDGTTRWFIDDFANLFRMDLFGVAPDDSVVLDLGRDASGWVRAFDTADASLQWQIDLPIEDGLKVWSVTPPVFDGDRAYFHATVGSTPRSYLYAIDLRPGASCDADLNGDGVVNSVDLSALLDQWGQAGTTDLNGDGTTGPADLSALLGAWGSCSG